MATAETVKLITIQTDSGGVEVKALRIIGQCAIHRDLTVRGGFVVTHILSGFKVAGFVPTVKLAQVVRYANAITLVDLDAHYELYGRKNGVAKDEMMRIYEQWKRSEGFADEAVIRQR